MNSDQDDLSQLIAAAAASATNEDGDAPRRAGTIYQCDVLIVDDAAASRELLTAILRNFAGRLELREARNGTEGLAMWTELNPRITLLDIDMPDVDGLTVLRSLRQRRPDSFVAMISGGSSVDNVRKSLSLGASGFVIKPYKPQRILDLLNKYTQTSGHSFVR
jgi:two-component system chemotaxis response regulator CheY